MKASINVFLLITLFPIWFIKKTNKAVIIKPCCWAYTKDRGGNEGMFSSTTEIYLVLSQTNLKVVC